MSTNHTTNYRLCQWERSDKVLMDDFNADNAKIDAALAGKAEGSALEALAGTVAGKADASALDSVSGLVAGHTAALARLGNCRIERFTYTGNGNFGGSGPTYINFSARPVFFVILNTGFLCLASGTSDRTVVLVNNYGNATIYYSELSWLGYQARLSAGAEDIQGNYSNSTYHVIAFYSQDGK